VLAWSRKEVLLPGNVPQAPSKENNKKNLLQAGLLQVEKCPLHICTTFVGPLLNEGI
jgi:hypothetical protein